MSNQTTLYFVFAEERMYTLRESEEKLNETGRKGLEDFPKAFALFG